MVYHDIQWDLNILSQQKSVPCYLILLQQLLDSFLVGNRKDRGDMKEDEGKRVSEKRKNKVGRNNRSCVADGGSCAEETIFLHCQNSVNISWFVIFPTNLRNYFPDLIITLKKEYLIFLLDCGQ